jgi:hypothetical protein
MKVKEISLILTIVLVILSLVTYGQEKVKNPLRFSGGIMTGYNRGFGIQTNFTAYNFSKEFPFELRFGIGCTFLNPGNAADARRIFINNATNGEPEKKGRSFDYRIDFLLPKSIFSMNHSYIVFGPRFSTFRGEFKYVGGNEDFEVTSHQWGVGGGIENHFKMNQNLTLLIVVGLDSYFPSTLTGHDTSYSPDNDNINPENDNQNDDAPFRYRDANRAIKQPMFMPRAMIGVNFNL